MKASTKEYTAGWFNTSIDNLFESLQPNWPSTKYVLVTCLDSDFDVKPLVRKHHAKLAKDAKFVGSGLLVQTARLLDDDDYRNLFFGFDEVWFFPDKITQPKPSGSSLVGPNRIDQSKLDGFDKWMSANSCSLAMGDGCGLNIIVKAHGLMKHLFAHTLEQPEATVAANTAGS